MTLNNVEIGREVVIKKLTANGNIKRRMLDLGFIEKTKIKPVFRSPLGDPTAYEIRGILISLREEETKKIEV